VLDSVKALVDNQALMQSSKYPLGKLGDVQWSGTANEGRLSGDALGFAELFVALSSRMLRQRPMSKRTRRQFTLITPANWKRFRPLCLNFVL
jgi:hypothetical protein